VYDDDNLATMEAIAAYESDNSQSEDSDEHFNRNELQANELRSVYLVTYSRSNVQKYPQRADFAEAVVRSFTQGSANIQHWCCSRERHADGGYHYHMSLKLDRNHRWSPSKQYLLEHEGISVHFSNIHHNYYSAWEYVTKEDSDFVQSEGHPRLANGSYPRSNEASRSRRNRTRSINTRQQGECDGGNGTRLATRTTDSFSNRGDNII